MRLRKIKNALELLQNNKYIINTEEILANEIFNNNNEIHLEIGTGKGDFIINMALKYPNINFIGLEKEASVLLRAVQKLENYELNNIKLINIDALKVNDYFNNLIDVLYLNFSDPWPKNRHTNRRLTSKIFLEKYQDIFKDKPYIIQKTDNRKFFEYSIISYVENGYKIKNISLDLYDDEFNDNVKTEYEKKFLLKGSKIYRIEVIK